jgi:glycosyltransferase involved in cell wall biosynthesis
MARITIDYTPAVRQSAGIGRLTREVVRALLALPSPHQFRLFCMGRVPPSRRPDLSANRSPGSPPASFTDWPLNDRWMYRVWHRARLPLPVQWLSGNCDLYHATDFVLPPVLPRTSTVLTVHDLTFERDAASAQPQLLGFLKRVVPRSARRATHIVADSYATAHDLTELYGIRAANITTIHSGVDECFQPGPGVGADAAQEEAALRSKYALGDAPLILTVGTLQKRKNHLTLVRAFAHLLQRAPAVAPLQLVIVGGKGWLYEDVLAEVRALGIGELVKFPGFVDDADLPALYRAASVFAFPSLYEGFGLPPLEAMACGTPVVASNVSSLPEVVGDAGLMVHPLDVDAFAEALRRSLLDRGWRDEAIRRGLLRARTFTWARAAEQLLTVYNYVLEKTQRDKS